jgi:PIN domain nuclease of toxin-antitoxin system
VAQRTLLLDTNVLLCALFAPERLNEQTQRDLIEPENTIYFSAVSLWEIAIKKSLNKIDFDFTPEDVHRLAVATGFTELPLLGQHTFAVAKMPWHHRDPFDRQLVAQAMCLPAHLLSSDSTLLQYSELVVVTPLK